MHTIANIPHIQNGSSSAYYNSVIQQHQAQQSQQSSQSFYTNSVAGRNNGNYRNNRYGSKHQQAQQHLLNEPPSSLALSRQGGYQLKVGGVVVGSWAGSAPNRNPTNVQARLNRAAIAATAGKHKTFFLKKN